MRQHPCPVCSKRACDSIKVLHIYKLSENNKNDADIVIKCNNCKNLLAVIVGKDATKTVSCKPDIILI